MKVFRHSPLPFSEINSGIAVAHTLDLHNDLKRKVGIVMLLMVGVAASIATVLHYQQPDEHLTKRIAPLILALISFGFSAYIYRKPNSINRLSMAIAISSGLCIVLPSWIYTLMAFRSPSTLLIDTFPPLTGPLVLWTTVILIFIKPRYRVFTMGVGCLFGTVPILCYLLLHPVELRSPRGIDLLISLGPALLIQITMVVFYSQLQLLIDKLLAERLEYYSKIIEEQAIRQGAMEQAFTQFHNGPLQSLAVLLRKVEVEQGEDSPLFQQLTQLNDEFRSVGEGLTQNPLRKKNENSQGPSPLLNAMLQLSTGLRLDLSLPLHRLLHEVYSATLKRELPYFQTIKAKVRNFAPIDNTTLSVDAKRDICLWLEEALCNVGKHAKNATRVQAIGECQNGYYHLKVQDNGIGLTSSTVSQGTTQGNQLAKRLGGAFHRSTLEKGGVICELSWPLR